METDGSGGGDVSDGSGGQGRGGDDCPPTMSASGYVLGMRRMNQPFDYRSYKQRYEPSEDVEKEEGPCPLCGRYCLVVCYCSSMDSGSMVMCNNCGYREDQQTWADMELARLRFEERKANSVRWYLHTLLVEMKEES